MLKACSFAGVLAATVSFGSLPSQAAGSADGPWDVKILPSGTVSTSNGTFQCPSSIIKLDVKGGAISGSLERMPDNQVTNGFDRNASALTGTIDANGNVQAVWRDWRIKGQVVGNKMSLNWHDECGLRSASGRPE